MRLKSLEMHGYKTFASQTIFEFAGMITAIVGPNGSGKSNVADSLRWVLGEQSYSLLRGKKTEDMIFAGSEARPRAGMASATVTFDNVEGWLPIEFSEVAITRRAYRDGQNEYLVNGQRVRLKDVTELLAQSGLAERTYTIIGQGVVDAALSLKAEERRRLFEEAAGIGLFRSRREEAIRRLETTQRNLERVQDILAELQPRLGSLERQARRAREYDQVRADLRLLLREWYGYHWQQAQRELAEARQASRKEEISLERVRKAFGQMDQEISKGRLRLVDVRSRLSDWHRQLSGLHARREELSTQRAVDAERQRALLEGKQTAKVELNRLEVELDLHQERVQEANNEGVRLEQELEEAQTQAKESSLALSSRQEERMKAEAAHQAALKVSSKLNNQKGESQARLAEKELVVERLKSELNDTRSTLERYSAQLMESQDQLSNAKSTLGHAKDTSEQAAQSLQNARKSRGDVEAFRNKLLEDQHAAMASLARSKTQLDVLGQAENALSGFARGAQALLKAARESRLKGARGALGSFLEVPAELEPAIAAALGEYLDALVVDQSDGIDEGLAVLEQETARGALLPLQAITPLADITQINQREDLIGVASQLVKAPREIVPVVELLLGRTLVVQDRASARRILSEINLTEGMRAVTLKGEVFHASGPVLAGGEAAQAALVRPRQRKSLEAQIESIEQQLLIFSEKLSQADEAVRAAQADEQHLTGELQKAQSSEQTAYTVAQQHEMSIENLQRQISWHTDRTERLDRESQVADAEASKITSELQQLEEKIIEARSQVQATEHQLLTLSMDEFQSQSAYWSTRVAVAEQALQDARARSTERISAMERTEQTINELHARLDEVRKAIESLDAEKTNRQQTEVQVSAEIESVRLLIEPAEAELQELEKQQEDVQLQESDARQGLSIAEHHHAQARIAQARREEAVETWKRRIEDDFGLVAFEYAEEISGPTPLPLEGMVEQLPRVKQISPDLEENMRRLRAQMRRIGPVNPEAQSEYEEVKQRFGFLTEQVGDLRKAEEDVRKVIAELDELMQRELRRTYDAVAEEFSTLFSRLFGGGAAKLLLTNPEDMTSTGIDIEARLPGKRMQGLSLLSGGERSLTATALIFSLLKVSPTPFCLLDEVDAMLDEANIGRFRELLRELSQDTQFILVTHNRNTVQVADVLYGVTMGRDSSSQVISLKMDEVEKVV